MTEIMKDTGVSEKMQVLVVNSGLEQEQTQKVLDLFRGLLKLSEEWKAKAESIVITDASQIPEIQAATEGCKIFQRIRLDAKAAHKLLKQRALNEGRFYDSVLRELLESNEPVENHLKAQRDFVKIKEEREAEERRIEGERLLKEQEEKEAAEAEKARLEQEEADRKERERFAKELDDMTKHNVKLRKEAEEKERKLQAERARVEKEKRAAEEKAAKERQAIEEKSRKEREDIDRKNRIETEKQDKILAEERAKAQAEKETAEKREQE
ncbi:hypothetical protein LCGC14_2460380, partial [marine sediment metagenome]